jgi:uncharacterized protein
MLCPLFNVELVMSERQEIEIDYCPKCRGVWLDRGELDKIIERSFFHPTETPTRPQGQNYSQYSKEQYHCNRDYKKHRRKCFLEELFD